MAFHMQPNLTVRQIRIVNGDQSQIVTDVTRPWLLINSTSGTSQPFSLSMISILQGSTAKAMRVKRKKLTILSMAGV